MGHLHLPHLTHSNSQGGGGGGGGMKDIPKGCLAIKVGHEGEEQQRFVIPIVYFNHPLFLQLLKEAEEEYGFDHKGTITLPCQVEEFINVQESIDRDVFHHHNSSFGRIASHGSSHGNHNQIHLPLVGCFKA